MHASQGSHHSLCQKYKPLAGHSGNDLFDGKLVRRLAEVYSQDGDCENYGGYQYNDLLTVIKSLKDVGAVSVTPRAIKLLNRDKLDHKLELVKNYYL